MALVFVSYSRQDEDFVSQLIIRLKENNIPVWVDTQDIETGNPWDLVIEEALNKATHILVVLSRAAVSSQTVRDEINWALDEDKKVVPILINHCTRPLRIRSIQYIDFTEDQSVAFEELMRQLPHQREDGQSDDDDEMPENPDFLNEGVYGHEFAFIPEDKKPVQEGGSYICPTLVLMSTDKTNKRHWTMKINTAYIGRENHCEIVVPSPKISRRQAQIMRVEEEFQLIDLGSTNGTWVNTKKLTTNVPVTLKHGDMLNFSGVFYIQFQYLTLNIFRDLGISTMPSDSIDLDDL